MQLRSLSRGLLALVVLSLAAQPLFAGSGSMAKVLTIVNGNTLRLEMRGRERQVRLMGVATPDPNDDAKPILKRLGAEAVEYLKEATKSGWVYVEFPAGDTPAPDGLVDGALYGGPESVLLNEKLVLEGFGIVNRKTPSPLNDQLLRAEETAKASHHGIWGSMESGDGRRVASGDARQGTFIGTVEQKKPQPEYVRIWIISFF